MDENRAIHQNIRQLEIAIVNLMPLKEDTELQILRSLSNTPLQVNVTFIVTETHESTHTSMSHLNKFYLGFNEVKHMNFLPNAAVNLEVNLMAFVDNLQYMGIGMVVIFAIIGIIIGATMLINFLFSE